MSWVFTLLIDAILSDFPSDFTFLPLGNTPLKGARTLRKPDAVFVPPQVARQFVELRNKFYAKQAKEDADEIGYWKSLADCGSDKTSGRVCATIAGAGSHWSPKTADDESEAAGTVDQAILLAERRNAGKNRRPDDDGLLTTPTEAAKQSCAIPWSQVPVAFELKRSGSLILSKTTPDNVDLDTYALTSTGSKKRKVDTPGSATSNKKPHVTNNDVQLARYMTEMRSALGHRTHTFGCLVRGKKFMIKYADPYGLVESEEVDFTQPIGLKKMAIVIVALARAKKGTLGFDARFMPPTHSGLPARHVLPASLDGWRYRVDRDTVVTIKEVIHVQWCQTGRGTSVYLVDHDGQTRVLKTSYPHSCRSREAVLLQTARERLETKTAGAGAGVTEVHSSAQHQEIGFHS